MRPATRPWPFSTSLGACSGCSSAPLLEPFRNEAVQSLAKSILAGHTTPHPTCPGFFSLFFLRSFNLQTDKSISCTSVLKPNPPTRLRRKVGADPSKHLASSPAGWSVGMQRGCGVGGGGAEISSRQTICQVPSDMRISCPETTTRVGVCLRREPLSAASGARFGHEPRAFSLALSFRQNHPPPPRGPIVIADVSFC